MEIKVGETTYIVKKPGHKELNAAKKFSSVKFAEYLQSGTLLRDELDAQLEKRGYWTQEKRDQIESLSETVQSLEEELSKAKTKEKKKELAKQIKYSRMALSLLKNMQTDVYKFTVESMVDDDYFDFLVSESVFDEEGNRIYKTFDEYQSRSTEELAVKAANKVAELLYGLKENWQLELPENKVLLEYNMLDDNLNLKDG